MVLQQQFPIQVLVELAQERDEDIPALVYEARSTGQPRQLAGIRQQRQPRQHNTVTSAQQSDPAPAALHGVTIAEASNMNSDGRLQPHSDVTSSHKQRPGELHLDL